MKALDIKTELKQLIESESDINLLESIRTILRKTRLDPVLKEKLTARALRAEKDIEEGRVYSRKEVEERLNSGK